MPNIIDLTGDSDEDDVYEEAKRQSLLAEFRPQQTQPTQPNSLKRKHLHDAPELNGLAEVHPSYKAPTNNDVFRNPPGPPSKWVFSPKHEERQEKPAVTLNSLPAYFEKPASVSSRRSSSVASDNNKKKIPHSFQFPRTFVEDNGEQKRSLLSSSSSSSKSPVYALQKRQTSSDDVSQTRSSTESSLSPKRLFPTVSVVVPPPPPKLNSMGIKHLSSRKIKRMPSTSSEGSGEESDPDEPKGIKTKYYPLDLHKLQADKGRYPSVRDTSPQYVSTDHNPKKVHVRAKHGKLLYLRESLNKKLKTIKGPPVIMAGDWNGTGSLASNFEFINVYKLLKGVKRVPDEFNAGCDCGPQCDPTRCLCLSKEEDTEALMVPYERRNNRLVLKDSFINKKTMIYECSSHCGCRRDCWNRLVQHGRTIRLEIFHTGSRGFGLRSPDPIVRGQFIDCYLGEVVTSAEADLREDAAVSQNSPSYLFSLDWFPREDDDYYVVDGQRLGGPSRFMNHSCNPNCKMFAVSTHHGDERIYDLAFFALRDIPPGTELTFDYNPDWNGDRNYDPNAVKCLCGEHMCRGQLWPNQRKSTKEE